jgi:hypothetical protein
VSDGTNGQVLTTDGSGTLSFSTISGYTDSDVETYLNTSEIYTDATNNRLGIGIASPQRPLDVIGGALFANGSADHEILFGDYNYRYFKLYTPASPDYMSIRTGSTDLLTITSDGNVGIGTTNTGNRLHIEGPASAHTALQIETITSEFDPTIHFVSVHNSAGMYLDGTTDNKINFYNGNGKGTAGKEITFDNNGNVGIGTTSPAAGLQVSKGLTNAGGPAAGASTAAACFGNSGSDDNYGLVLGADGYGDGYISAQRTDGTATTYDLFIQPNGGNVGIGTTSPVAPVTINDKATISFNVNDFVLGHQLYYDGAGNDRWERLTGYAGSAIYQTAGNVLFYRTAAGGATGDAVTPSESMRITSDGNLRVGYTGGSANVRAIFMGNSTSAAGYALVTAGSNGTDLLDVRNDGAIYTGNGVNSPKNLPISSSANLVVHTDGYLYKSTSSRRYKNTITDATHGLTELLTLRPVTYKGNSDADGDTVYGGLIAEEVHDAGLTEFVVYNEDDEPDALAYSNMVSLCVKAIQEQQALIQAQATTITDLTARIETLEG